ncbi:MAG: phosphotransferase [Alphaproteobacteria bacterium]|jgi:aminoglycoside phosphotransferase (APT) family kinase protein|nr:phosphotransferase [Alphaproteobacteria bacterium]
MSDLQAQFAGTQDVLEQHRINIARLQSYMEAHVEGFSGAITLSQFKGGQSNPTYRIDAGGRSYVLRRKPPGVLLPSAHAVDREYRVITALAQTDVPAPKTYCLCEDEGVIGTVFYIMEMVQGRILWDSALPDMSREERGQIYRSMNQAMAALHKVDYAAIGLGDFGKVGEYRERQIHRWSKTYRLSEGDPIPAMDRLIEWLPLNIPAGDETTLIHGDFRMDNMVFHPTEPRVIALLDWELATLGHPVGDFTYTLMGWRLGKDLFRGIADADLPALGIPTEAEYIAQYCAATGRDGIQNLEWYLAYNMFRLAAILQGIAKRAQDGTAASPHAVEQGRRAGPLAEAAWRQVERLAG